MQNKVMKYYKLLKKNKVNGYTNFQREYRGDMWGKFAKIDSTVSTGDLQDPYIDNWTIEIINADPIGVGDIFLVDGEEYVVQNVDAIRNKQFAGCVREWHIKA